jgi:tetratricopeptide (TPR) repeat protein
MRLKPKREFAIVFLLIGLLQPPAPSRTQTAASEPHRPGADDKAWDEMNALIASHEFDRAERLFDELLRGGAKPAAAYFAIGKIYFDHQEWDRSAPFLEKSAQLEPAKDQVHLLLGLAWRELRRPDDAEREFLEAARKNPSSEVNAYFAGHQLVLDSKFEAALPYLYKAIDLNPHRAEAYRAVALAQAHVGNYGLAESYYRKAIEAASRSGQADYADTLDLSFLLLLGHDQTNLLEGLKLAQQAEELQPDSAEAHYLAGKALFKLGRIAQAIPELERGEKLNPDDSKPHFLLAQIFDQLGQPEKARKEREALARTRRRAGQTGVATGNPLPASPD